MTQPSDSRADPADGPKAHGAPGIVPVAATAFLAMAASALAAATFEFMLVPLQTDLGMSADQASAATLVPTGASLLVVFVVGALGDRLGERLVMVLGALSFVVGAALVAAAWNVPTLVVGRALAGIGALTMTVIGLAVVNAALRDEDQRARAFAAFAALVPAVFVSAPLLSAWMTTSLGWRTVPALWIALGVVVLVMAWRLIPSGLGSAADAGSSTGPAPSARHREMVTPVLAGVALAGLATAATIVSSSTLLAASSAAIGVLALALLVVVMRRSSDPTLDLRVFRRPGALLVFTAALVASMPNLFFYTNLLIQYRYALPLTSIALLLAVPQAAAVAGGLSSAPLVRRFGALRTSVGMLLFASVASLGALFVHADAPVWVPVAMLTVCAVPIAGAVGPLTKAIMDLAPVDGSAAASSWRNAVWSFGGTVGGVVVTGVAFAVFQSTLTDILDTTNLSTEQSGALAASVRGGAVVAELAQNPAVTDPAARELLTGPGLLSAQSQGFATAGVLASGLYLLAAGAMVLAVRRRER